MDNQTLPIRQAANGDQEAFGRIVRRMEPLIHAQIHSLRCDGTEDEDMAQEALMGLLAAVRTYRPDGGAAFTTYATTCIRNRLLSVLRRIGPQAEPLPQIQEQEETERLLDGLQQRLTPMGYQVLLLRLSNGSYEEIARRLGVTKKAVDNAVQRIRRKFRQ